MFPRQNNIREHIRLRRERFETLLPVIIIEETEFLKNFSHNVEFDIRLLHFFCERLRTGRVNFEMAERQLTTSSLRNYRDHFLIVEEHTEPERWTNRWQSALGRCTHKEVQSFHKTNAREMIQDTLLNRATDISRKSRGQQNFIIIRVAKDPHSVLRDIWSKICAAPPYPETHIRFHSLTLRPAQRTWHDSLGPGPNTEPQIIGKVSDHWKAADRLQRFCKIQRDKERFKKSYRLLQVIWKFEVIYDHWHLPCHLTHAMKIISAVRGSGFSPIW